MRRNSILALLITGAINAQASDSNGMYEIVALDRAEFPRYDGGWNPGSGAEVEFSGWKFFKEGRELKEGSHDVFFMPDSSEAGCGGLKGAKRFFTVKASGEQPSYAQRTLNQKIWDNDMLSATLILPGSDGGAGMVVGRQRDDGGATSTLAIVRDGERLLVLDGGGEQEIDMPFGDCPIGVSLVFSSDGTYTLQVNEVKEGGKIVDIGPRKPRSPGVPGIYTLGFFAKGGAEVGFDDLQVERIVK